ncbi:MAG: D-alanine-D-alanine ligase [Candidatus Poriferisodalaceae bacterium]|jgi:D-alanine-D-alanine ligase
MSQPAVCFGSPSPEHDISILTGLQAVRALTATGNDVIALYWSKTGDWYEVPSESEAADFADGLPRKSESVALGTGASGGFSKEGRRGKRQALDISAVVNCCHGVPGEDGTLQALFDLAGVRYTGPSQWGAAIGMDKLAFTGVMQAAGVPVLPLWLVTDDLELAGSGDEGPGPYIVKPRFGGSSIGIEIVDDLDTAKALSRTQPLLKEGAVIQRYLADATDLNISVKTHPQLSLSAVEKPVRTSERGIYSYSDKYLSGQEGMASAPRELPADIPTDIEAAVRTHAASVAAIAMVRSVSRIDFLWNGDGLWVNEINTIPGSLSWYFWAHEGIPFGQLLAEMLAEAAAGPTRRFRTDGADGAALRSVGAIAAKLG